MNLLANAVRFTEPGGRITVSSTLTDDGGLAITVADTGIGIDENGVAKALTVFGQVDSGLSRGYEGTGLGLPLSKGLVEAHDGLLSIESRVGEGTTVTVLLPPVRVR